MPEGTRRFRLFVLLGCLLMIASGFLPWWHAGGDTVSGVQLPAATGVGLEGVGLLIYGAAIVALVVLDIGYMRGRWGFILDAPFVYLLLGLVAAGATPVPGLGAVVGGLPAAAAALAGAGRGRGGDRDPALRGRDRVRDPSRLVATGGRGQRAAGRTSGLMKSQPTMTSTRIAPRMSMGRTSGR